MAPLHIAAKITSHLLSGAAPQIQQLQDEKEEVQEELEAAQKELGAERAASATLRRQVLRSGLLPFPMPMQHKERLL